ncbi:methyltransferase [Gordonia pseudamarae]|jgi:predicted O-methyltransferase YrrM|uniref:Methyltransferase n=1 Tax=Gordonia pseudamarae TaxID=2831662 RepID=A0ABX6IMP3_9ACTN|nr:MULTISPECIES: class I SAM-dependent methyltransferase [Gordonia]MBD0023843.1 class I SAM-dependent methyltransferase [Gordonia sp. (in: high G+C Gram-positive bacteria)]QHN28144.1 methyltransferase [Gordonia pseudamarae]QHN37007.1 methyltransferase [Gordonia pseudamarae]
MISTLHSGPVADAIERLYAAAQSGPRPGPRRAPGDRETERERSVAERAADAADAFMAISPDTGRLLYSFIRAAKPPTVVEFGMSYGISTLFLAAAVRDNNFGRIYTTELSEKKIAAAQKTFIDAGVGDLITVLAGDARDTLTDIEGQVGVVLLDGWKELYLPVITLLESRMPTGAVVVADNAESPDMAPYLDYVRDPANGYVSVNIAGKRNDTVEISSRV